MPKSADHIQVVKPGAPWLILATVLLAILKVTGKLKISWLIVTLPLWAGVAVFFAFLALLMAGALAVGLGYLIVIAVGHLFSKKPKSSLRITK